MSRWAVAPVLLACLLLTRPEYGTLGLWSKEAGVRGATSSSGSLPGITLRCVNDVGLTTTSAVISWDAVAAVAPLVFAATVEGAPAPTVAGNSVRIEPSLFSTVFGVKKRVKVTGTLPKRAGSAELTDWRTVAETDVFLSLAGTRVTCA